MKPQTSSGFTLLELLVVIGLIGAMSFFLVGGLRGGQATALHSGQAMLANVITAARTQAPATGRRARLLINVDPAVPDRYLRNIVLQLARQPGSSPAAWDTITEISLPGGVYVVPASLTQVSGLVGSPSEWKRISDPAADLVSDVFANQALTLLLPGDSAAQAWTGIAFTPNGTLAALGSGPPPKGSWVLTLGVRRPPGSYRAGEAPVHLGYPQAVRGVLLSAYGVPAFVNERRAF